MPERKTDETFLSRWSRRKIEAAKAQAEARDAQPAPVVEPPAPSTAIDGATPAQAVDPRPEALPPVESLTFDSDFRAFMKPGVDEDVQRAALRKLLRDPRFNVMDGLDVYIDDYTKPAPLAADVVAKLAHARYLFSPPATRVNAEGVVEDVPEPAPTTAAQPSPAIGAPEGPLAPRGDATTDRSEPVTPRASKNDP
jgi:hypothetical protein